MPGQWEGRPGVECGQRGEAQHLPDAPYHTDPPAPALPLSKCASQAHRHGLDPGTGGAGQAMNVSPLVPSGITLPMAHLGTQRLPEGQGGLPPEKGRPIT
jgi:hypothetical protein